MDISSSLPLAVPNIFGVFIRIVLPVAQHKSWLASDDDEPFKLVPVKFNIKLSWLPQ